MFVSNPVMELIARGKTSEGPEVHGFDPCAESFQGGGAVTLRTAVDRLDDQAHPLLLGQLQVPDDLQHALRVNCFSNLSDDKSIVGYRIRLWQGVLGLTFKGDY